MAKEYAKQFYSSKAWQACRNEYAKRRQHLCENCLRRGIYRPGEIVHHKIEVSPLNIDNPEIVLNHDNLELLCRVCHSMKHERSGGRWQEINKRRREKKQKQKRFFVDANGKVFSSPPLVVGEDGNA